MFNLAWNGIISLQFVVSPATTITSIITRGEHTAHNRCALVERGSAYLNTNNEQIINASEYAASPRPGQGGWVQTKLLRIRHVTRSCIHTLDTHTHSNNKRQTTCGPLTANSNYIYTPFPLFPFPLPLSQPLLPSCNPSHLHRLPFPVSRLTFRSPQSRNDRFIICLIAWLAASSFKTLCQRTANSRKQTAEIRLINNLFNYQPVY